ncbi:hypothetical protein [Nocardia seriolae]|uniref:Uncharacterized protein n=1 Tax=Nocardia seriolae TaxID=37332 RepID=A0ABC9YQ09_9NOCA|nr:hypothetical protein [Nocardia seriolae]BEK93225.1 hypothetical protein NSER024013_11310 [Nocardia seriolae]GAM45251.1 hypothetical protein NS07_v2contig00013-0032 [Nocardia seriolae]GAP27273.1 hypothetical protein NSK11_contig00016-0032 [Nocardia seriolae]
MELRALREFVQGATTTAEIESFTSGQGILLPGDVRNDIAEAQSGTTPSELTAGVVSLRNLMPGGDLFHTSLLTLLCGTMVKRGADPGAAIDATLDNLVRQLDALATGPDESTRAAAQLSIPAAMTMLARSKETRKRWYERSEIMDRLDRLEDEELVPLWLRDIFTLHDDLDLLVLDPKNRRAFEFRLIGVRDRLYHCYALLQDALLRHVGSGYLDAEPVDPLAVRYARNDHLTHADHEAAATLSDHQRFNFAYPGVAFMPGSGSPEELPKLDGKPLLTVAPKGIHFNWRPSNMYGVLHTALRSSVELTREFPAAEAESLLTRCGLA